MITNLILACTHQYHFNEASWNGTTGEVIDSIGGNNGTASGAIISTSGKLNNCGSFSGLNPSKVSGFASSISSLTSNSKSVWFKTTSTAFRQGVMGTRPAAADQGFGLNINADGAGSINYYYPGGSTYTIKAPPGTVIANQWTFFVFTFDSPTTTGKIFVNGNLINSQTNLINETLSTFKGVIGNEEDSPSEFFSGLIDEVSIFNRALTQAEINFLYNNGNGTERLSGTKNRGYIIN